MIRTRHLISAALLALALTGCGAGDSPEAAPSSTSAAPATSAARLAKVDVECANVERAYKAWAGPLRATTADQFAQMNELEVKMAAEKGKSFLQDVTGYDSQASKNLAVAIADYNYKISLLNLRVVMGTELDTADLAELEEATTKVETDYQAWKSSTCS